MTGIARREVFGLAAGAVAIAGIPRAYADEICRPRLVVFDSRLARSRSFARNAARDGARSFDIAGQDDVHWKDARTHLISLTQDGAIGVTRWSDWVNLRGLLSERRLRVLSEQHLADGVFAWAMARRA